MYFKEVRDETADVAVETEGLDVGADEGGTGLTGGIA
jgi:hypothetical protein